MDIRREIENLLTRIRAERVTVNNELKRLPKGSLMISGNGKGRLSYFQSRRINEKRVLKGIGSDQRSMEQLARKAYLLEVRDKLDLTEDLLKQLGRQLPSFAIEALRRDLPKHFDRIPEEWLLGTSGLAGDLRPVFDGSLDAEPIRAVFTGASAGEWMFAPYCANSSHGTDLIHKAPRGFFCRSKSEAGIAGLYDELGIPYHYDELMAVRMTFISPDFRGIRRDARFICHEHWGLQSEAYIRRNLKKLFDYASEGYVLGRNLLITCDDEFGGIDLSLIREQIKEIYRIR